MEFGKKIIIGNFYLLKFLKQEVPYIKVGTVSEIWSMEYGVNHNMFRTLDNAVEEEFPALSVIINNVFATASIIDLEYSKDVAMAINKYIDRQNVEISEEEDKKILEQEKEAHIAKENIIKLSKEAKEEEDGTD